MKPIDPVDAGIIAFFVGYFVYSFENLYYMHKMKKNAYKGPEPSIVLPLANLAWNQARGYPYAASKSDDLEKKTSETT